VCTGNVRAGPTAVALSRRVEERAAAELVDGVHVRAGLQQRVDDEAVAVQRREDQGRVAVAVGRVDVGAGAQGCRLPPLSRGVSGYSYMPHTRLSTSSGVMTVAAQ
jgi:hypothetical protein